VATGRTCGKVEVDKCTHGPSLPALPPFGRQGLWLRHNKLREGTEKCNDEVRVTLIHLFSEILKKEKTITHFIKKSTQRYCLILGFYFYVKINNINNFYFYEQNCYRQ